VTTCGSSACCSHRFTSLQREGVRIRLIGDYSAFGPDLVERLERAVAKTASNERVTLVVALNYGSRAEIADATRRLAGKAASGEIEAASIDETSIEHELQTHDLPPLDLLIRTSGEMRVSNFLLWQIAYAEIWVTPTLWPDFRKRHLFEAILDFQKRERRYGGVIAEGRSAESADAAADGRR